MSDLEFEDAVTQTANSLGRAKVARMSVPDGIAPRHITRIRITAGNSHYPSSLGVTFPPLSQRKLPLTYFRKMGRFSSHVSRLKTESPVDQAV